MRAFLLVAFTLLEGCASHSERLLPVRYALDTGRPHEAIRLLSDEMGVSDDAALPDDLNGDNALLVLDRGSIQQSVTKFDRSKRDFEAADKAVDMLDLQHGALDTLGEYIFSGSSGKYRSPPYEKLLVNTLDMINYLELRDLNGARVEARRLAVMQRHIADDLHETENTVLGLGGFLAGLTFEKSERYDEALRWYDEALGFSGFGSLRDPVQRLLPLGTYRSPRLRALEAAGARAGGDDGQGEMVFVIGYGRVPHKIAQRVPIGLALTWASDALQPNDVAAANQLAAQGLVTWINYPTLGPENGGFDIPRADLDGRSLPLEEAVNVTREVQSEWKKIEGKIVASAITRLVARYATGTALKAAAGKNDLLGTLLSLGAQVTLTAFDTPDTRSWETLPARIAVARVRVPAGRHTLHLAARGLVRDAAVDVASGDWTLVSLMALQ